MNEREEAVFQRIVEREAIQLDEATRFKMMVFDQRLEDACFFYERSREHDLSILEGYADQHFNQLEVAANAIMQVFENLKTEYDLSENRAQLALGRCRLRMRELAKRSVSVEDTTES